MSRPLPVSVSLSLPVTLSVFLNACISICPCFSVRLPHSGGEIPGQTHFSQPAPVYTMHASSPQRWLESGVWERDSASILFIVHHLVLKVSLFVCAGVCVCACLSNSLPHTFADVFPHANIMAPIDPATTTHKSELI